MCEVVEFWSVQSNNLMVRYAQLMVKQSKQILEEEQTPQEVFVENHAGLVVNQC